MLLSLWMLQVYDFDQSIHELHVWNSEQLHVALPNVEDIIAHLLIMLVHNQVDYDKSTAQLRMVIWVGKGKGLRTVEHIDQLLERPHYTSWLYTDIKDNGDMI
jgi:hypothetical protein